VASGIVQLTPIFKRFVKQVLAFVAVLVITAAVSTQSPPFVFASSAHSLLLLFLFCPWF
jgi:hypothetical protein